MACHERIEELAERSQGLPLNGRGLAEAVYVAARVDRADLLERQLTRLAPREELADAPIVGATGGGRSGCGPQRTRPAAPHAAAPASLRIAGK